MALKITILGLDALGASLGMALGTLDQKALDGGRPRITGWDARRKAIETARGRLAIDVGQPDLAKALVDADVVFVNVPPADLRTTFESIVPHLKHGTIVTDTLSVKRPVLQLAREVLPTTVQFVGGHPFVQLGSAEGGRLDAFRNVIYCLVPGPTTAERAIVGLSEIITAIGAKPYYIDAAEHDAYAAGAGHLPAMLALTLMETLSTSGGWREIQPIAGEGLVTATSLLVGSPAAFAAELAANREALLSWITSLKTTLDDLQAALADPDLLSQRVEHALAARDGWLRSVPHTRPGEDGIYTSMSEMPKPSESLSGLFFGRRSPKGKK